MDAFNENEYRRLFGANEIPQGVRAAHAKFEDFFDTYKPGKIDLAWVTRMMIAMIGENGTVQRQGLAAVQRPTPTPSAEPAPRPQGRPKGSKNKPKVNDAPPRRSPLSRTPTQPEPEPEEAYIEETENEEPVHSDVFWNEYGPGLPVWVNGEDGEDGYPATFNRLKGPHCLELLDGQGNEFDAHTASVEPLGVTAGA